MLSIFYHIPLVHSAKISFCFVPNILRWLKWVRNPELKLLHSIFIGVVLADWRSVRWTSRNLHVHHVQSTQVSGVYGRAEGGDTEGYTRGWEVRGNVFFLANPTLKYEYRSLNYIFWKCPSSSKESSIMFCLQEPHTMLNGETEMNLKAVLNRIEGFSDVNQVQLLLYMLVSWSLRCSGNLWAPFYRNSEWMFIDM